MEPTISEPNLWRILKRGGEGLDDQVGLMIVYVDDLLVLGKEDLVSSCLRRIEKVWELSKPEWLSSEKPFKFLGVEMWEFEEGIFINQESYLLDVLRRHDEEEGMKSGIPITKDQALKLEETEEHRSSEDVRMAQKVTGELMWMVTKSRPDLMFLLAKMSQSTLKSPREVASVARQAWKYLRRTASERRNLVEKEKRRGVGGLYGLFVWAEWNGFPRLRGGLLRRRCGDVEEFTSIYTIVIYRRKRTHRGH